MKVHSGVAEFQEIYARDDHHAWARLLWEPSGRVIVISDYGNWSYFWGHRGEGVSVEEFLSGLDKHYMGKKMMGSDLMEFSLDNTVQAIREHILKYRSYASIESEEARDEWELAERLEDGDISYDEWIMETSIEDPWELSRKKICSSWKEFWYRLWVPLIKPRLEKLAREQSR